jgi:hypothetical protein
MEDRRCGQQVPEYRYQEAFQRDLRSVAGIDALDRIPSTSNKDVETTLWTFYSGVQAQIKQLHWEERRKLRFEWTRRSI